MVILSPTQGPALQNTLVEVVIGPVPAIEGLKLAFYVTLVKLGFTLTVLVYLIQPSMILAEVTRLGNVTIVDFQIFHQGSLIQLFWAIQVLTATHHPLHHAPQ